jgi:hypothetical protein
VEARGSVGLGVETGGSVGLGVETGGSVGFGVETGGSVGVAAGASVGFDAVVLTGALVLVVLETAGVGVGAFVFACEDVLALFLISKPPISINPSPVAELNV